MPGPLVVAWQYIDNGLASWGWEAAHALAEAGEEVVLVHAEGFPLPTPTHERVCSLSFSPSWARGSGVVFRLRRRLGRDIGHILQTRNGFVYDLHCHLQSRGIVPRAYLLNQSDLMDERVATPQYPVAWAYPTHLQGYLDKTRRYTGGASAWSWKGFGTTRFSIGWYRRDWRAYRRATGGILAVSERIAGELRAVGVHRVCVVHPGTQVPACFACDGASGGHLRIITVAVELEDPRKRVRWMLEALKTISKPSFTLTVVGKASAEMQDWARTNHFPVRFTGPVSREAAQGLMAQHDLFLFGSLVDDWGYVLIEAMGQGLMVAAPNLSPFDEIVGDSGILYPPEDPIGLARLVSELHESRVEEGRHAAYTRAREKFSRPAFARSLLEALENQEQAASLS